MDATTVFVNQMLPSGPAAIPLAPRTDPGYSTIRVTQAAVLSHLSCPLHAASGSSALRIGTQVPLAPVQALQLPQDATEQQRLSTQAPLGQSAEMLHESPARRSPVPDKGTLTIVTEVAPTFKVADLLPAVVGLKVTITKHCPPAASVPEQAGVPAATRNSPAFAPASDTTT
jgi:hypothetical protein